MKFLIKQISPSRKEIRVSLNSIDINGINHYIFGTIDNTFDEGTINSDHIPTQSSNYYSIGPNPGIIRLIVAYLKDNIGTPSGFANCILTLPNSKSVPVVNIAIDDISLINLSSDTTPSMVIKVLNPLPSSVTTYDEIIIEKKVINTQEQDVYYISAKEPSSVYRGLVPDYDKRGEIGNPGLVKKKFENLNELTSSLGHTDDTILNEIISGSDVNLKINFSNYENHVHFGSAVSKLDNFVSKIKNIEDSLSQISQSLLTGSNPNVNLMRVSSFKKIQSIKDDFTPYEKALYYK